MKHESELLRSWTLDAAVPANFNSVVWRRIQERRRVDVREAIGQWMTELFARPTVAVAYLSLAVLVGVAAAQVQSSKVLRERRSELEARYVQAVDPYVFRATR
jgi:hypothetical protein